MSRRGSEQSLVAGVAPQAVWDIVSVRHSESPAKPWTSWCQTLWLASDDNLTRAASTV